MLKSRRFNTKRFFEKYSLDAVLFTDLKNIRYLSGFTGSEAALLLSKNHAWFLCDSRYTAQAHKEVCNAEVKECGAVRIDTIVELASQNELKRIGFEASHTTVTAFRLMSEKLTGVELVEIGSTLDEIRICKDADEIQLLSEVAELSAQSLIAIIPQIKSGVREIDIAFQLELEMRKRGAEGKAFDFIVASGVRGSMPHGVATEKIIQSGEFVTIDFGAVKNGYHSDETVTFACGVPEAHAMEIYSIVKTAHDLAIDALKPGMSCKNLDEIARAYITDKGYGDYFGHGLGHGVGLEIHELPTLSPRSSAILEEGMVITVEPGIYIPDFGGVRIEDTLVVTSGGCRSLTIMDKELRIL